MVAQAAVHGGEIVKPHLVRTERDADLAVVRTITPEVWARPITRTTAEQLRQMMVGVVSNGSGSNAAIAGVEVGGKTGTAEKGEGQAPDNWFVCFANDGQRQIAVAVVVEDGGKAGFNGTGSAVAAPIARDVMMAVLNK
jgi:peptidoglycan glycosyltransferase